MSGNFSENFVGKNVNSLKNFPDEHDKRLNLCLHSNSKMRDQYERQQNFYNQEKMSNKYEIDNENERNESDMKIKFQINRNDYKEVRENRQKRERLNEEIDEYNDGKNQYMD